MAFIRLICLENKDRNNEMVIKVMDTVVLVSISYPFFTTHKMPKTKSTKHKSRAKSLRFPITCTVQCSLFIKWAHINQAENRTESKKERQQQNFT